MLDVLTPPHTKPREICNVNHDITFKVSCTTRTELLTRRHRCGISISPLSLLPRAIVLSLCSSHWSIFNLYSFIAPLPSTCKVPILSSRLTTNLNLNVINNLPLLNWKIFIFCLKFISFLYIFSYIYIYILFTREMKQSEIFFRIKI